MSNPLSITKKLKIVVIRPDRLGDVILSTPVFQQIKTHYPNSHLTFFAKENVLPLMRGLPSLDACLVFDPEGRHRGRAGFFTLVADLKQQAFEVAIVLQSHRKIAAALFLAQIPKRIGPWSKPHSFLFYNFGMKQRRSLVEKHEADYNLQLLEKIGIKTSPRSIPTQISVSDTVRKESHAWLKSQGWDGQTKLVVIHPGMGGSALNWPERHYIDLMKKLTEEGCPLLITGGPTEHALLERMKGELALSVGAQSSLLLYASPAGGTVEFLAGLFSYASVVIAPSTGPLHVAVALGKPVVTFYPSIRVQSPKRWGPYVLDSEQASVLVPSHSSCMEQISVEEAFQEVKKHLERGKRH